MGVLARAMRGQIIDIFVSIEALMDDIIAKTTFGTEEEYYHYMDILDRKDLPMVIKKKMFKLCIDKHATKHNIDLSTLKATIDHIIDSRNVLAHWVTDTSIEGKRLFTQEKTIRFIKRGKDNQPEYKSFKEEQIKKLEKTIISSATEIVKMQNLIYRANGLQQ